MSVRHCVRTALAAERAFHATMDEIIEFAGLVNQYIEIRASAHRKGIDFTSVNQHHGQQFELDEHQLAYLNEKSA